MLVIKVWCPASSVWQVNSSLPPGTGELQDILYVCMCVCMYVCMCVCMYVCMYVCVYVCVYVCMYVCM